WLPTIGAAKPPGNVTSLHSPPGDARHRRRPRGRLCPSPHRPRGRRAYFRGAAMFDALLVKENIVHIGAALYLAGFLFRDQLMLRGLIVAGDLVYIAYFYFAPVEPLWGGIFWSAVFVGVNLAMIGRIVADRAAFGIGAEARRLYAHHDALTPGE